jgi:hypothetical protein
MLRRGVDELINVVMGPFVVVPNPRLPRVEVVHRAADAPIANACVTRSALRRSDDDTQPKWIEEVREEFGDVVKDKERNLKFP